MIVSRKAGNAVERSRIKRLFREVFRHIKNQFSQNVDIVVRAKANSNKANFYDVQDDIIRIVKRKQLLKDDTNYKS